MYHGWSTCERSLFFKKANLATVWFLGNFNLLFGMFDWSPVFYSGTDEWKYNLLGVSWTLPFVRAAWNTTLKLCNIPVVQKPEENELLLLGLLEKQQEYKLHVFLKKSLKIHFIRGISRKTLYCLCKIKNKADSPFSFLIWVTSNWMLPVWFLRLSLSLYSKAKLPSKSELKSFFCFNFSFKKITFSHKRSHFASLLTCEWQVIKLIKSMRRGVPEERVKFSFKTTFIKGGLIGWVACFHNTDERMLTSLSQTWIWILEKFT